MDIPHTEEVKLCLPKDFEFTVTVFLVKRSYVFILSR